MAIGDILNPRRVRMLANERADTIDVDSLSIEPREHLDAYGRAVEVQPRNVGSTTPTGLIIQGFGLTLNPTGPSDAKVRVQSPVGVAFDSNGRLLIKENGVQVDLTLSAGNSQIYAYFIENGSDTSIRRFIPVAPPFTPEGGQSISTKFKSDVAFFVQSGDQTSILASATVLGVTTPLCFIGVANNSGGVVTMTGYDATTAPNGAFATNRLTSIVSPSTLPLVNTNNGSIVTMHGLVNAALFLIGQLTWKGSTSLTPSAANNFGAFTLPAVGVDALFDSQGELVFPPITKWRDFQHNIRLIVDYLGYPGGQISVKDEHWAVNPQEFKADPMLGFKLTGSVVGTVAVAPFGIVLTTSSDAWGVPLGFGLVPTPTAAIIIGIIVRYTSTSSSNTLTAALNAIDMNAGTNAVQVSRTITTATGSAASFDVMVSPTSGHGPKVIGQTDKLMLSLSCTIASGSITVYGIQAICLPTITGWQSILSTTDILTSGDAIVLSVPVSGLNQRNAHLTAAGSGSTLGSSQLIGVSEVFVDNDLAHTMEFMLKTGVVDDSHHTASFSVSVNLDFVVGVPSWGISYNIATSSNWKLNIVDDSNIPVTVDTGVAVITNTVYRFKVDFLGSNRNSGGHARARVWINGTLVGTANVTGIISPAPASIFIAAGAGTSAGPYDFRVGRLHRVWNHRASGDNI